MIKKFTLFSLLIASALMSSATTFTVDNTPGTGAQYNSIDGAINAAAAGDTILVHSSQYSYGSINIYKQVVLIGPGHHPEVNAFLPATINSIGLGNGCAGTVIEGLTIGNLTGLTFNQASDITIRNNFFNGNSFIAGNYGDGSNADNWLIEGNLMIAASGCGGCTLIDIRQSATGNDNWTFRNNFIQSDYSTSGNFMIANANSTTVFANNIFVHNNNTGVFSPSSFALLENNIFWINSGLTTVEDGCVNCTFNNNLFNSTTGTITTVAGVGNVMNQNPQFVNLNGGSPVWNYANDYHLSVGSPAIGSAADGDDMGLYGADYNFRMFGYTNDIPRITQALPQYLVVPVNSTFTIDFSAAGAGQ